MKIRSLIASALLAASPLAHAESFFEWEAGVGAAYGQTLNDGVWYQQGNPDSHLGNKTPVFMLGLTGEAVRWRAVDLRWHLDYVYIGGQSASCACVPDDAYNAYTNQITDPSAPRTSFSGQGHVQGVAATLDVGYNFDTHWRAGVEAGPWVFWETWHENADLGGPQWFDASHKTTAQVSWVAGANVSYDNWTLRYRYYNLPQLWNPFPGLLRAAHVVTLTYRHAF